MGFKCGIVGLPNVGKSTLFNVLTHSQVAASNYPFCTIDPNVGTVIVPDNRLQKIADIVKPARVVPTTTQFVDIAGLVKGAAQGEGLGNQFLSHIRQTQAIAHVVRCFEEEEVVHVSGKIDPLSDIETIQTELALADLDTLERALLKITKEAKAGDKKAKLLQEALFAVKKVLNAPIVNGLSLSSEILGLIEPYQLLSVKPKLYVANVGENEERNKYVTALETFAAKEKAPVVRICVALEAEIARLPLEEQRVFYQTLEHKDSGLQRLIQVGYELLGLMTFFTAGPTEVRAWTCPKNTYAPQAGAVIHSDFETGFIRAEVMHYDDFIVYGGEAGVKEAGKWRLQGKDYVVEDGDILLFRFANTKK